MRRATILQLQPIASFFLNRSAQQL
jgi:hypothetical protein